MEKVKKIFKKLFNNRKEVTTNLEEIEKVLHEIIFDSIQDYEYHENNKFEEIEKNYPIHHINEEFLDITIIGKFGHYEMDFLNILNNNLNKFGMKLNTISTNKFGDKEGIIFYILESDNHDEKKTHAEAQNDGSN